MSASRSDLLLSLNTRWPDNDWRLMFHGTAHAFEVFSEQSIGKGADANSALGIHLAEFSEPASEYAQASAEHDREGAIARVLVVALPARFPSRDLNNFFKFFGEADAGISGVMDALDAKDHTHFAAERQRLLALGHDVVDYEDGEQVIAVALNPADLVIVGELTPEAAEHLHTAIDALPDPFAAPARLAAIEALSVGWTPSNSTPASALGPFRRHRPGI